MKEGTSFVMRGNSGQRLWRMSIIRATAPSPRKVENESQQIVANSQLWRQVTAGQFQVLAAIGLFKVPAQGLGLLP